MVRARTSVPRCQGRSGQPSKYIIGEDIGFFYFPPIDPAMGKPALAAGDAFMVTAGPTRGPSGRSVPVPAGRLIEAWIDGGSAISANNTTPAEWYPGTKWDAANHHRRMRRSWRSMPPT